MRLPHPIFGDVTFTAANASEIVAALGEKCGADEREEIARLYDENLPPVTSRNALAVILGYNPGFVWSLLERTENHYRIFKIPKGASLRQIEAPKIALKVVQKWLAYHLERKWTAHDAVHGFVCGRSHLSAADKHRGAEWVVSVDIEDFFPTTSKKTVEEALFRIGYGTDDSVGLLSKLCCFRGRLSQGAPTSPVLSNVALHPIDSAIERVAQKYSARFTRYADDIVLSGSGRMPRNVLRELNDTFDGTVWRLSMTKRQMAEVPQRLKVHGLLVHGNRIRLTKRYRNRIRAYRHLLTQNKLKERDMRKIIGHLNYASQVDAASEWDK